MPITSDRDAWRWLTSRMTYLQGDLNDPDCYQRLGRHLDQLDKSGNTGGNHLFYLAVADRFFGTASIGSAPPDLSRKVKAAVGAVW